MPHIKPPIEEMVEIKVDFYAGGFKTINLFVSPELERFSDEAHRLISLAIIEALEKKGIQPDRGGRWRVEHKYNKDSNDIKIITAKIVNKACLC